MNAYPIAANTTTTTSTTTTTTTTTPLPPTTTPLPVASMASSIGIGLGFTFVILLLLAAFGYAFYIHRRLRDTLISLQPPCSAYVERESTTKKTQEVELETVRGHTTATPQSSVGGRCPLELPRSQNQLTRSASQPKDTPQIQQQLQRTVSQPKSSGVQTTPASEPIYENMSQGDLQSSGEPLYNDVLGPQATPMYENVFCHESDRVSYHVGAKDNFEDPEPVYHEWPEDGLVLARD